MLPVALQVLEAGVVLALVALATVTETDADVVLNPWLSVARAVIE